MTLLRCLGAPRALPRYVVALVAVALLQARA